ncbi:hypothetical protein EYF80_021113 [Liparis tanakae]|uniref:Uncharacterized protein n=1 Tax=Liparis tanakae TaxID=230148 RepID=A0A4Z2HUL3_9TELE|nr:hypothetical protein EYF80_021113 [Liparis tanakae]
MDHTNDNVSASSDKAPDLEQDHKGEGSRCPRAAARLRPRFLSNYTFYKESVTAQDVSTGQAGIRSSFVERAGQTLRASGKRFVRRGFCACTKMCAELDAYMYTPKDARHTQSMLDQRQAHAEHALGIGCMFVG